MPGSVLIAEDEPSILEALSFILRREGYEVLAAADGEAALHQLRTHVPGVIILDVMLPKVNGFEVLRTVRADPRLAKLPVIMLTAKGQTQDRRAAEEIGVDMFVTKPFSNREIVAMVNEMLPA